MNIFNLYKQPNETKASIEETKLLARELEYEAKLYGTPKKVGYKNSIDFGFILLEVAPRLASLKGERQKKQVETRTAELMDLSSEMERLIANFRYKIHHLNGEDYITSPEKRRLSSELRKQVGKETDKISENLGKKTKEWLKDIRQLLEEHCDKLSNYYPESEVSILHKVYETTDTLLSSLEYSEYKPIFKEHGILSLKTWLDRIYTAAPPFDKRNIEYYSNLGERESYSRLMHQLKIEVTGRENFYYEEGLRAVEQQAQKEGSDSTSYKARYYERKRHEEDQKALKQHYYGHDKDNINGLPFEEYVQNKIKSIFDSTETVITYELDM
ncbi:MULTISPECIES: hypothetical protein [unclassified Streptococcus]|uniref:hypothetical protein n=1 Tax=unclassified Streptococcus TaxID=2608887 RepID=UPI00359D93D1